MWSPQTWAARWRRRSLPASSAPLLTRRGPADFRSDMVPCFQQMFIRAQCCVSDCKALSLGVEPVLYAGPAAAYRLQSASARFFTPT